MGTSFAVGITDSALTAAAQGAIPTFSFNLHVATPAETAEAELASPPLPPPSVHHIVGGCELTLPALATLVAAPLATSTAEWYEGYAGEAEAAALAGLGSVWSEVTTGDTRKTRSAGKKRDRVPTTSKHETTWVACDACGKWRRLPPGLGLSRDEASGQWRCEQNVWDPERQSCEAEEEPWA